MNWTSTWRKTVEAPDCLALPLMKSSLRILLTDLKAALAIGQQDAIAASLDGLRQLPEVSGNQPLPDAFIIQAILPVGELLASPQVPASLLLTWQRDALAAVRAAAAAALSRRYLRGAEDLVDSVRRAGSDGRPEVRHALAQALGGAAAADPARLLELGFSWTRPHKGGAEWPAAELRLCTTALAFLPALAERYPERLLVTALLLHRDLNPDVRSGLVGLLTRLAQSGQAVEVLDQLTAWAHEPEPNDWLINKVLSGAWAKQHEARCTAILETLPDKTGGTTQSEAPDNVR